MMSSVGFVPNNALHDSIMSGRFDHADGRQMWSSVLAATETRTVCEIGVYKGDLAMTVLSRNSALEEYVLIDPWRNLEAWNKPANKPQADFDAMFHACMRRLAAYEDKLTVLRGTTQEVIKELPDASLDAVFIDGDHTLRGITLDLGLAFPKVKPFGLIGLDDFTKNIWQHGSSYDPSIVHPYAVYFAELHDVPCYSMPAGQAWIVKDQDRGHAFHDRFGYRSLTASDIFAQKPRH